MKRIKKRKLHDFCVVPSRLFCKSERLLCQFLDLRALKKFYIKFSVSLQPPNQTMDMEKSAGTSKENKKYNILFMPCVITNILSK